jgi:nucleoside-triphosphatase
VDICSSYRVGRYRVDVAAFEELALPEVDPTHTTVPLIIIDEIGKMECFSASFCELIVAAIASDKAVLATIALRGGHFLEKLKAHPDVTLLHVTPRNRDQLVGRVAGWASEMLARA